MIKTFTDISVALRGVQQQLEEFAEENGGDITDFPLMERLGELEKLQADRAQQEHLFCNLACMVLEYEGEGEAMRAQAKRILEEAAKVEKKADGIRAWLGERFEAGDKVKDDRVTLSTRKSTAVEILERVKPTDLPLEYQRVTVAADKSALKKALEAGEEIDGVSLLTRHNLQIK